VRDTVYWVSLLRYIGCIDTPTKWPPCSETRSPSAHRRLTTQQIADRLSISPKTTEHHIQHIYNKMDVSPRAAAALWAMQNAVMQ